MKSYFIDTNCLLSYLTDRNVDQQERITPFIEGAAVQNHNIIIIQHIVTECVYVLSSVYHIQKIHIAHMLNAMVQTPGMYVDSYFKILDVLGFWPGNFRDYGDAVLATAAQQKKGIILTFDELFYRECTALKLPATVP